MSTKLEFHEISRAFPGVQALDRVSFGIQAGEVHALVGENGAGKSTLIKIVSGALQADAGEMVLDGRPYRPQSPKDAFAAGISTIHQELNWLPGRSAMFNILLGHEPYRPGGRLDFANMRQLSSEILQTLRAEAIPLNTSVEALKAGQKQILEIARALLQNNSLLVMDEPTAALNPEEQEALFKVIEALKARGLTVLYVTHRLEEVFRLADRVTVLRDGHCVSTAPINQTNCDRLIGNMIGRQWIGAFPPRNPNLGPPVLTVAGLSAPGAFREVSFTLRAGEILGVIGLAGSGKEELGKALFGAYPLDSGEVHVAGAGQVSFPLSPAAAIGHGIAYIPEDRKAEGVILPLSVRRNICLPLLDQLSTWVGHIRRSEEVQLAQTWVERLKIRTPSLDQLCQNLSGGNQQKVALAKWLASQAQVLILAEPTQGIDVGVKFELYQLIADLSRQGTGIILISSELPEILGLSHTILVMRDGEAVALLKGEESTSEMILRYALGQA
ncbi:MAG: D-xylose ABC transporter ATP-binding protein [Chloroflexota bacterium]